jgi:hypothetical protein
MIPSAKTIYTPQASAAANTELGAAILARILHEAARVQSAVAGK